jgi:hypothetical protein
VVDAGSHMTRICGEIGQRVQERRRVMEEVLRKASDAEYLSSRAERSVGAMLRVARLCRDLCSVSEVL